MTIIPLRKKHFFEQNLLTYFLLGINLCGGVRGNNLLNAH